MIGTTYTFDECRWVPRMGPAPWDSPRENPSQRCSWHTSPGIHTHRDGPRNQDTAERPAVEEIAAALAKQVPDAVGGKPSVQPHQTLFNRTNATVEQLNTFV